MAVRPRGMKRSTRCDESPAAVQELGHARSVLFGGSRQRPNCRGIELVNARLADLQARYRRGAKAPPELLSPKSKATLDRLRQWSAPAAEGSR